MTWRIDTGDALDLIPIIGLGNDPDEAERTRVWLADTAEGAPLETA